MKYEIGDIVKDKYTHTLYMITKITRIDMNWYLLQSIQYGSTRNYNKDILDSGFEMFQKGKR